MLAIGYVQENINYPQTSYLILWLQLNERVTKIASTKYRVRYQDFLLGSLTHDIKKTENPIGRIRQAIWFFRLACDLASNQSQKSIIYKK